MTRYLGLVIVFAVGLAAVPVHAESIFGLYGIGERVDFGGARVGALGGFVQMEDDSLGVLQYNPATLAWAKRVTFGAAGYFTSDQNQAENLERRVNATKLSTFAFAFPVFRKRVSAGLGYRGRYDPDGEFRVQRETAQGAVYTDAYERNGSLWSVPIAIAVDVARAVKVGGFVSLERGTVENRWAIDFESTNSADAGSIEKRTASGTGYGAGVTLHPADAVSLGFAWESAIDYDIDLEEQHTNEGANRTGNESATLPARYTASAIWRVARAVNLYAGASISDFADFEGFDVPTVRLTREEILAFGVEYRLGSRPLRASVRLETLPYTLPDGEEISKFAIAVGSGLTFRSGRGKLEGALQFGSAGSVDTNGFADKSVRVIISITGSEEWKRKRGDRF